MIRHEHRTILGTIPEDWQDRPLRSLLLDSLSGDWGEDAGEEMVAVLRSTNFKDSGNLNLADVARRGFSKAGASAIQVQPGDILLERSGGGPDRPVGRVVQIRHEMPHTGFANFIQCLRPNSDEVQPEYLHWALYQFHRCGQVARFQHQTTQMRNLDLRDYHRVRLPYPDRDEQSRIASALGVADNYVGALSKQLRQAECVRAGLLQSLFVRGMPEKNHDIVERHGVHFPAKWKLARLGDLLTHSEYGISSSFSDRGAYQILRMVNVTPGHVNMSEPVFIDLSDAEFERYRLRRGDILFNRTNSWDLVGRVGIVCEDVEAVFASYLVRLRTNGEINPFFLNYALNCPLVKQRYRRFVTPAVSQANINVRNLRQTWIAYPDVASSNEQYEIVEAISAVDELLAALHRQLDTATRVKQSLLQNLLTGKVRLKP